MMGSIRDQTMSRNAILVPQVYAIENSKFLPDGVLYVLRARLYYGPDNISSYEFIVELASRCANLGMSL
jgi:hypothetical protein